MPLVCVKNCGCRHPDRAHCVGCHQNNEKFKIKHREEIVSQASKCCSGSRELDYLFVIDFECTCDAGRRLQIQEIIEFPIVVIDLKTMQIIDKFHSFVRPTLSPKLTDFCTKLTRITQAQVDAAPTLPEVLKEVDKFLEKYLRDGLSRVSVLNDCDSDIRNFLANETTFKDISVKPVFKEFIDLRRIFPVKVCDRPYNIDHMLSCVGLTFEGIKHSGIDDATNIARVALEISKLGYVYTDLLKENMFPYDNPHYYEHLVIIAAQPKMKNNVELAMIAHDLRKGTTLWKDMGQKHVKKQEMKQELFAFLDKVGIDVDNSIICVQGKLENEVKQFFQQSEHLSSDITKIASTLSQQMLNQNLQKKITDAPVISSFLPFPLNATSSATESTRRASTDVSLTEEEVEIQQQLQQQNSKWNHNYFTTYFSLNKISKIAGVNTPAAIVTDLPNPFSQHKINPMRPFQSFPSSSWQQQLLRQKESVSQTSSSADINQNQSNWWSIKTSNNSALSRITSMCSVVETALQNGFIFSKDLASTISMKRASFPKV